MYIMSKVDLYLIPKHCIHVYSVHKYKSPQSHQLLRTSRMNSHTAIKILLRSTHLHRNAETLQHLTNTQTEDMQTDDLFLGARADQLHLRGVLGLLLGGDHVVEHGCEFGLVDLDVVVTVAFAGLRLCETRGADFRV